MPEPVWHIGGTVELSAQMFRETVEREQAWRDILAGRSDWDPDEVDWDALEEMWEDD